MYGSKCSTSLLLQLLLALLAEAQIGSKPPSHHGIRSGGFTPTMAIIIVILISVFFLMAFFSVYLRLCAGDIRAGRGSGSLRRTATRGRSRLGAGRGLDRSVIESFPTFEYSVVKELKLGKETLECAVCLNEFEDDNTLRLLPNCCHVFHPDCIDAWLFSHITCPVCRSNLLSDTVTPAAAATPPPVAVTTESSHAITTDETQDEVPLRHDIAIDASEERNSNRDVTNLTELPVLVENRPVRSKSNWRSVKFPRSHSTGHSLVQPGENVEKFTLRLPDHVRKEVSDGTLGRSSSCKPFRAEGGSVPSLPTVDEIREECSGSTGRFKWRLDRAAKSDRWAFLVGSPFFSRTLSGMSQKRADGEQTANAKGLLPTVMTPFDCLGPKVDTSSHGQTPPVFTVSTQ